MDGADVHVRTATAEDGEWVVAAAQRTLGSEYQVHSRRQFLVHEHELLVAEVDAAVDTNESRELVGFLGWIVEGDQCEVLAIATDRPRGGVGTALLHAVTSIANERSCRRIHLTTTDENVGAQRFYESAGFTLAERLVGAVDRCREQWKPEIPANVHDELVYERVLR